MIVRQPANFGWPFCITPDSPYVDYDFTPDAEQSGEEFNCFGPTNDSRNNTGLRRLPPVAQPDVWYSYNTGSGPVPGAVPAERHRQRHRPDGLGRRWCSTRRSISPFRWPREFNGQPLFYEWTRDIAKVFELNRPNGNRLVDIRPLFGGPATPTPNVVLDNPMDMEFGPDNALYDARVRHGLLRGAARGAAGADRLRPQRPVHAGRARVGDAGLGDDRAARRSSSRAPARRTPTATACPTRGTSTPTGPWTRAWRTRRTPTPRAASMRPRCA